MAAETIPIFTINDFPPELIERFAPDLRPKTVSTLRLVSKRFRDVFGADSYYRSYLMYYPYRLSLYHDDLEMIGDEDGKWKRLLEAEKRRLEKWKNGEPTRVDTVELPSDLRPAYVTGQYPSFSFCWQGKVGKKNEYWMLAECLDKKIALLNITKTPILTVIDVSSFTSKYFDFARILPDQVMIDSGTGSKRVFNISIGDKHLSLEYFFTIETTHEYGLSVSGNSSVTYTYESLYLSFNRGHSDLVFNVWDLQRGFALGKIALKELLPPLSVLKKEQCTLLPHSSDFPYVSLAIYGRNIAKEHYLVLNVEEKRIACSFDERGTVRLTCVKGNQCFLHLYNDESLEHLVKVYDFSVHPTLQNYNLMPIFQCERKCDLPVDTCHEPHMLIIYCSKQEKGTILCVDGSDVQARDVSMGGLGIEYIRFAVGPFLLAERSVGPVCNERCLASSLDMFGKILFDFGDVLSKRGVVGNMDDLEFVVFEPGVEFHSLSRCILSNNEGDSLYICTF